MKKNIIHIDTKQKKRKYRKGRYSGTVPSEKEAVERYRRRENRIRKVLFIIWCVIMLGIAALPAVFMKTLFGYLPVLALALIIALSLLYVKLLKKAFTFEEDSEFSNCIRGSETELTVRLKNHSILVYTRLELYFYVSDIFGGEGSVTRSVVTLAPFEERSFSFDLRFGHIGIYEAGLRKVVIHDLLGLFEATVVNEKNHQIRVSPKVFDVARLNVSRAAFKESRDMRIPISTDGIDYTGVREYAPGDAMKTIHWKLSARHSAGGYYTRQYESYGTPGIAVIMDFQSPHYDSESLMCIFDGVVETALSLEYYAKRNGMECELLYAGERMQRKVWRSRKGGDAFELIMDLPKVSPEETVYGARDVMAEESRNTYGQGNIAYCTSSVDAELTRLLMEIRGRRKNPLLFVIVPPCCIGEERRDFLKPLRSLDSAGIPYYVLETAKELQGGERRVS